MYLRVCVRVHARAHMCVYGVCMNAHVHACVICLTKAWVRQTEKAEKAAHIGCGTSAPFFIGRWWHTPCRMAPGAWTHRQEGRGLTHPFPARHPAPVAVLYAEQICRASGVCMLCVVCVCVCVYVACMCVCTCTHICSHNKLHTSTTHQHPPTTHEPTSMAQSQSE